MVSQTAGEYLHRAAECERLAALAKNAEVRQTLRYLAQRWRDLAVTAVAESDWKRALRRDMTAAPSMGGHHR